MRAWTAVASLVVLSVVARGAGAGPGESGVVSLRGLPEGKLSPVPAQDGRLPAHVGAGEKVPGFFLARPPRDQRQRMGLQQRGLAYLFPSAEQAKAFSEGSGIDQTKVDGCFADGTEVSRMEEGEVTSQGGEWSTNLTPTLPLEYSTTRATGSGVVRPVHAERFVTDAAGKPTLETVDAWVDAATLGVRLIGRTTVPLARIAVAPEGLEVYGARSGSNVLVVVHTVDHPVSSTAATERLRETTRSLQIELPGEGSANSDCGLAHYVLHGQKGAAEMVSFQGVAVLPALEGDRDASSLPKLPPGMDDDEGIKAARALLGLRFRTLRATVSASQTSTDQDPVVSVAFGWTSKAVQQP
jgi:hypothetical protein